MTFAAIIALTAAGCSQEVQRFDYGGRDSQTMQLHFNETRDAEEGFASWRRGSGDSLRAPRGELNSDPVTRSLRDDTDPLRGKSAQNRGRLKPIYDQEQPPPRRTTHKVRPGDTLYSIARSHGIDADILARANRLSDPNLIRVGDTLYIPEDGTIDRARGSDRRRAVRRDPGSADPRQARRDRRYVERSAPRYSDDALYTDPLLRERQDRADRRRAAPRHRADDERDARQRRPAARSTPNRDPIRNARAQRAAPATPPPAPEQRPARRQPSQMAQAEDSGPNRAEKQKPARFARIEPPQDREVAGKQETSTADCSALMKDPPARSGANFRRPANGLIVSRFGEQSNGQRNDGINISVPRGTPVKAAENGVVVYAGDELTGLGKLVLVRHAEGWVSAYAHNDEIKVSRCDMVERGQMIARAGVSGSVSKPQLHFELRKNARPVDPEQHLAGTS